MLVGQNPPIGAASASAGFSSWTGRIGMIGTKWRNHLIAAAGLLAVAFTTSLASADMEPFGLEAVSSRYSDLIIIWRELQLKFAEDEGEISRCRVERACSSSAAKRLISIVDEARHYDRRQLIGHLNRSINAAIPATRANVPWLSPLAALSQAGDCKSYAIAKYLALADAGIDVRDRRLVMLRIATVPAELHLAVLVRDGERWLILDSRTLTIVDSAATRQYVPLHEFDENGVRDFRRPTKQMLDTDETDERSTFSKSRS